jgi:hypothetical protein
MDLFRFALELSGEPFRWLSPPPFCASTALPRRGSSRLELSSLILAALGLTAVKPFALLSLGLPPNGETVVVGEVNLSGADIVTSARSAGDLAAGSAANTRKNEGGGENSGWSVK